MSDIEKPVEKPTGRFRKVEVRTWGDAKFCALSPIPACGQGLWLYLITGPHTGPIPGLFRAGRAAMAEALNWDLEAFDKAFREVLGQGMAKADFKARVVWVPNAIKHNRPESPNVVRSWAAEFDLTPECGLKWEAIDSLKASVYALGEPFAKAFNEALAKASSKPCRKTMANQEQEQEQEQEKNSEANASGGEPPAPALPPVPAPAPSAPPPSKPSTPKDIVYALGVPLLTAAGVKESNARSFLAMQCKVHGDAATAAAIEACALEQSIEPISWIQQRLKPKASGKHAGFATKDYREGITEDGSLS